MVPFAAMMMKTTETFDLKRLGVMIIGKPVNVELISSVLKGDDLCEVAVHLPPEVTQRYVACSN